jgi:hypothetical protein
MPIHILSIHARLANKKKLTDRQLWRLEFRKRFLQGSAVLYKEIDKEKEKTSVSNPKSKK